MHQRRNNVTGMELGLVLLMILSLMENASASTDQYARAVDWLSRYGYISPPDPRTSKLLTKEGIEEAIRVMQRFGGVRETGQLDEDTIRLMSTPRCSLPDIIGSEDMLRKRRRRRRKRYALSGLKWDKTDLTWSIDSYPTASISPDLSNQMVDAIMTYAFKAWSDAAPLNFQRLSSDGNTDIRVSFAQKLHDDGYPFDGRGGTLAHAFFPGSAAVAGDTHFDDDEFWSYGGISGSTDLFTVAVHEFGHALGLSHSSSDPSIMRPYYQGPVGDISTYRLELDDMLAIQQLYGVKYSGRPGGADPVPPRLPTQPPPRATQPPRADPPFAERCEGGFDAIANIRGEVFFFKGAHFWRIQKDGSLVFFNPATIKNFWFGLPPGTNRIDAVYERRIDSKIIFFIGSQYWVFKDTQAMSGYPRPLSDWGLKRTDGTPVDRVDAAFTWAHNGKTYLFSGEDFWRFDESQKDLQPIRQPDPDYPRNKTVWGNMPFPLDDIISWGDGDVYFFKDNLYWVTQKGHLSQELVTPKSVGVDWLSCPAPTTSPPKNPKNPECTCPLAGSSAALTSSWLLLVSVILVISELISKP